MNKVYILVEGEHGEGYEILSVHTRMKEAKEAMARRDEFHPLSRCDYRDIIIKVIRD